MDEYDSWAEAFVYVIGRMAKNMSDLETPGKRLWFHFNNPTFHRALDEAFRLECFDHAEHILKAVAEFNHLAIRITVFDNLLCFSTESNA